MTTVLTFNVDYTCIYHVDKEIKSDPWDDVSGEPTTVGIEGKLVLDKTLRSSTSIRSAYTMYMPSKIDVLFEKCKLGVGSKHIYHVGDFMKAHYDTRLPPMEILEYNSKSKKKEHVTYNHIMTLLLIKNSGYRGGDLYVEDKKVVSDAKYYNYGGYSESYVVVLFSLNASHEVKPVTEGTRHVFAFPVYGEYNPMLSVRNQLQAETVYDIKSVVMEKLKQELLDVLAKDTDDSEKRRAMIQGYVTTLGDHDASAMFTKYRKASGDYVLEYSDHCDDEPVVLRTKVTYMLDGVEHTQVVYDEFQVPAGATCVTVSVANASYQILENLIDYVSEMQDADVNRKDDKYHEETQVPDHPFTVFLTGRYFNDSTTHDLTPDDRKVLDVVKQLGRKIEFMPVACWDTRWNDVVGLSYVDGKFIKGTPHTSRVNSIEVEFDDQGGYDPIYSLVYGMLLVV